MSTPYLQDITVRWADLDPNGHVRHSVYYDYGAQVRIAYLDSKGLNIKKMFEFQIGPVLFREEARFLKELRFGDKLKMDFQVAGLHETGKRWRIRHHILRGDELCATVEMDGAWLSLRERRVVEPPDMLAAAFNELPRTEDFETLVSRQK